MRTGSRQARDPGCRVGPQSAARPTAYRRLGQVQGQEAKLSNPCAERVGDAATEADPPTHTHTPSIRMVAVMVVVVVVVVVMVVVVMMMMMRAMRCWL